MSESLSQKLELIFPLKIWVHQYVQSAKEFLNDSFNYDVDSSLKHITFYTCIIMHRWFVRLCCLLKPPRMGRGQISFGFCVHRNLHCINLFLSLHLSKIVETAPAFFVLKLWIRIHASLLISLLFRPTGQISQTGTGKEKHLIFGQCWTRHESKLDPVTTLKLNLNNLVGAFCPITSCSSWKGWKWCCFIIWTAAF